MTRILMAEATDFRGPTPVGSHALARQFTAAGAAVMWIGTPVYPHTLLHPSDSFTRRRVGVWKRGGLTAEGVTEYYPLTFLPAVDRPLLRSRVAVSHTLDATVPRVESVIRRHGFAQPDVLWLSNSRFSHALVPMVRARVRACRLSDDWAHFGNVPRSLITLHDRVVDGADVVFVTSRRLQEKLRPRRADAVYLPNAVPDSFFAAPGPEPPRLAPYARPRLVFVGRLDAWVDFDVIARVGERLPRASVIVVGPGEPARRDYPDNVHFTGAVPYPELPALLAHCDVALIPFVKNELTHAVSPLKLFEYLATGVPVVATRLDEMEAASPPALLCDGAEAFADAVESVLDGDPAGRQARIAFAREHTWARRFDVVRRTLGL